MKALNISYLLSWTIWCADPWLITRCAAISFTVTRRFSFTMASTAAMASGVTTRCVWPGPGQSVTELMPFMNFLVHPYTCCSDRHASPFWTFIRRWISMGVTPSLLKNLMTERCSSLVHVASGGRHLYTTTAPSCCIPASYCHLSATLQAMVIIVVNLQDNGAVFRIFIALLLFSFNCPSYIRLQVCRIFFLILDILHSDTVLKCHDGQSTECSHSLAFNP